MRKIFLFFILIVFINACNDKVFNENDRVLARVYDSYLFVSDLKSLVSSGTNPSDSLDITKNYIQNWIKNQLILNHAEKNLTDEQKNFTRQLEDYRNSLIIYKYETELIKQRLDTIISEKEIEYYYDTYKNNLKLRDNIVQVLYVKLNIDLHETNRVKELVRSDDEKDRDSLEYYCLRYAEDYEIIDENWMLFSELINRMPIKIYNDEAFLNNNKFIELKEKSFYYFINILNYRIKDSMSPLSFEYENIKSIILNKRKKLLLRKMEEDIFNDALKNNDFEYY